jgi:hypothetical protein
MKHLALALGLATGACTVSTSTNQIDSTPLAGTVDGYAWTFVAGNTDAFISSGQDNFFASMYPTTYTACSGIEPSGPHLLVAVPKVAGDYQMNLDRNMTFVVNDNNLVATQGRIVVDSVSATQVTGGMHAIYDGANEVNGQFSLTICSE